MKLNNKRTRYIHRDRPILHDRQRVEDIGHYPYLRIVRFYFFFKKKKVGLVIIMVMGDTTSSNRKNSLSV